MGLCCWPGRKLCLASCMQTEEAPLFNALSLTLSISSDSKQMRIHSRAGTYSAPLSAMRPTRSMQFSCTWIWQKNRLSAKPRQRATT